MSAPSRCAASAVRASRRQSSQPRGELFSLFAGANTNGGASARAKAAKCMHAPCSWSPLTMVASERRRRTFASEPQTAASGMAAACTFAWLRMYVQ